MATRGDSRSLQILASVSGAAFEVLYPLAIDNRSVKAAKIAIYLKYIGENLSQQDLPQIPLDAQDLSVAALRDLVQIAKWPPPGIFRHWPQIEEDPLKLWRTLSRLLRDDKAKYQVQQSVTRFCKQRPDVIQPFESRFIRLWDLLEKIIPELQRDSDTNTLAHSPPPSDTYPGLVHKLFLAAVRNYTACTLAGHVGPGNQDTAETKRHITKLCLESGFRSEDQRVIFKAITAASELTHWQELAFRIPICNTESKNTQGSQQRCKDTFNISQLSLIRIGDACETLQKKPNFARINIELGKDDNLYKLRDPEQLQHIISRHGLPLSELLRLGKVTDIQRVKLSYTVARAFWLFYDSEIMDARWTSEDILLFYLDPDEKSWSPEDILLRVFVSFPFGSQYRKSPAEYCGEGQYVHRYPRILYLGIILLEIGLGQALEMGNPSEFGDEGYTNMAHFKAVSKLKELQKERKGPAWNDYFVAAIKNCLNDHASFRGTTSRRRDVFYQKVVAPLFQLATQYPDDPDGRPSIRIPISVGSKSMTTNNTPAKGEELKRSWNEIRQACSSFLSGPSGSTKGFLDHLQEIAGHIKVCRGQAKAKNPIRVAILDTGCEKEFPFFKDSRRSGQLRGWKDFTHPGSQRAIDTFGHGTYMARLLMHVAPIVDIYVIRVAENTEDLEGRKQNIANAIIHAGLDPEWKTDIISMSFGFPNERKEDCKAISDAIEKVIKERNGSVLFFAAAGNSGIRKENFPASHKDVMSIYATDSNGTFLGSNPPQHEDGPKLLGTYGTDIPLSITDEIQKAFPQVDLGGGSSIATAVAAGVAAMTLAYVDALPSLLSPKRADQIYEQAETECAKLHTKSVMEQMLYGMSVIKAYKNHFINPIGFWGEKQTDLKILAAVFTAVNRSRA